MKGFVPRCCRKENSENGLCGSSPTGQIAELLENLGVVPLPPYIRRVPNANDRERYQTVFAERRGSIAAPTAGLHFTPEMLGACRTAGAEIAYVTLTRRAWNVRTFARKKPG